MIAYSTIYVFHTKTCFVCKLSVYSSVTSCDQNMDRLQRHFCSWHFEASSSKCHFDYGSPKWHDFSGHFHVWLPEKYVEQLIIKALKCQDVCLGYTSIFHVLDSLCEQNQTADSSSINQTHFVRSLSSFRNTRLLDVYRIQPAWFDMVQGIGTNSLLPHSDATGKHRKPLKNWYVDVMPFVTNSFNNNFCLLYKQ